MAGFDPTFTGSGSGHRGGSVPDPGATAGSSRFLCEDGTFRLPYLYESEQAGGSIAIDFTAIPQTGRHLRALGLVRSATIGAAASDQGNPTVPWTLTLNGGSSGYAFTEELHDVTGARYGAGNTGQAGITLGGAEASPFAGFGGLAACDDPTMFLRFVLDIPYYADTYARKAVLFRSFGAGAAGTVAVEVAAMAFLLGGAGVDRVTFGPASGNFHASSLIQLLILP